jgi:hypothetical protein
VAARVLGGFTLDGEAGAPLPALPKRRAEAVLAVLPPAVPLLTPSRPVSPHVHMKERPVRPVRLVKT